jgi:hypothetical protein
LVLTFEASHDYCTRSKRADLRSNCWLACPDYVSRVGSDKETCDGLTFEGAGASFIGSGQTTTLNCAGGGAHILGNNNTLTLTGACKWLDMVGSNNTVVVAFANGANIEFAGSNNAITWTSPDGKEPVVRHVGSGNTLTAGH